MLSASTPSLRLGFSDSDFIFILPRGPPLTRLHPGLVVRKSGRSHVVLWAKELIYDIVFLRPLGLRLLRLLGLRFYFHLTPGSAADAAAPGASGPPPLAGAQKFRSLTRAICPLNSDLVFKPDGVFTLCPRVNEIKLLKPYRLLLSPAR